MQSIPDKMKGVQLIGHGGPETLKFSNEIPVPSVGCYEVLIKVAAAGINNTDINTRTAWYSKSEGSSADASWSGEALVFPRIQGADVCGVIVAVGDNVSADRIGERVIVEPCITEHDGKQLEMPWYFGSECDGGFADYTVVASKHAYAVNSAMSDAELASFPCSYSTAENMLTRTKVTSADKVLITGASGGVGSAAIQLAKARGAYVVAVTTGEKSQLLLDLRADETVSRDSDFIQAVGKNSIDVVIDLVAGNQWSSYLEVLKPKGRYAVSGAIGGAMVDLDVRTLYLKDLSFFGCTVLEPEVFSNLVKRIERRQISPIVAETYPLQDILLAQESFQQKKHVGKIVLRVEEYT